jgi:hypothetical protein
LAPDLSDQPAGGSGCHRGWNHYIAFDNEAVKQIALYPLCDGEIWSIDLLLYPGDTLNQARRLYDNMQKDRLYMLLDLGWDIKPNMHFSFRASNLVWTHVAIDIKQYIDYWMRDKCALKQLNRDEFASYFSNLERDGIISLDDWEYINSKIINTKMKNINVCPGIELSYKWTKKKAIDLDNSNKFIAEFKDKLFEAIKTWEP